MQVIECRRILKWTYAYGYYSFEDEGEKEVEQRRQFFEFLQGDAERILDQVGSAGEHSYVSRADNMWSTIMPDGVA